MLYDLIKGKVYCKIFDKSFKLSNGMYNKFKEYEEITQRTIKNNIESVKQSLGTSDIFLMKQVHGNNIVLVDHTTNLQSVYEADASVTLEKNITLGITSADCVPVLLSSLDGKVIGAIHCGWKSARLNIVDKVVELIYKLGGSSVKAFIGPAIKQKSYEVDKNFYQDFLLETNENRFFFAKGNRPNHYIFDLVAYVENKLLKNGVEILFKSPDDTYSMEEKYPSFRRHTHNKELYNTNILSTISIK
ncbi:MAG TPA: peptidoglycan editing factor PgeF [Candidatus Megaira endosymbiont of Nemacystus decipiens]|nr:peptidoglycan editing factor PgeF [Candidatus Megaera endosymbiont of Nemacystus decipiens]